MKYLECNESGMHNIYVKGWCLNARNLICHDMSLEHLYTGKSAQFFRLNPRRSISKTSAAAIVQRVSSAKSGRIQEKRIRESLTVDGSLVQITYVCFPIDTEPSFLAGSGLTETHYAYLLLVEAPKTIAVFKRNVEGLMKALAPFVLSYRYEELGGVYADSSLAFEKISLSTMSLARGVVRRRVLEAENLADSMAVAGIHRSIPKNFRARSNEGIHTIAPGSARISRRDTRARLEELVRWVIRTGAELEIGAQNYPKTFLAEFCTAVPLSELPSGTTPNAVLFDLSDLRSIWEDSPGDFEFSVMHSPRADRGHVFSEQSILSLFALAEQVFQIEGDDIVYTSPRNKSHIVGGIRMNKNTIGVRSQLLDQIVIRYRGDEKKLSTYLNQENKFLITFSEPAYAYAERQLFRDLNLINSIDGLLRIFEPKGALASVTSEKAVGQSEFGTDGIFRFVEDSVVSTNAYLVCDDLGDEWADYIAVDTTSNPPRLQFLHCKHKTESSSASDLQEPIGQAVKNLSRMSLGSTEFNEKADNKWNRNYSTTHIARIRRGKSVLEVKEAFGSVLGDPNTERSVVLILSSISLKHVRDEFALLKASNARPHVSQLLWLLSWFVSACREHGVRPHIICQP